MLLGKFPRQVYTKGATPLEELKHLTNLLNGPQIFMKRDDLLGLTAGGNKTRKLEFLMADALKQGADTIITCGAIQSNHCRLTLAAAIKEGLSCQLVLEERVPNTYDPEASGNIFLYQLLGAERIEVVEAGVDLEKKMQSLAEEAKEKGKNPYIIPGGGSNVIGSLGYVACAMEILQQSFSKGLAFDYVVTTSGSGGTHAGLLAGFLGMNAQVEVIGINVSRTTEEQTPMIQQLTKKVAEHLDISLKLQEGDVICEDDYVGEGYSLPTDQMKEAVQMLARTEGILLDPVYTGKAMAGMIDLIRQGTFKKSDRVLFLHTGGTPALYANRAWFKEDHFSKT